MVFTDDTDDALQAAVALVNSAVEPGTPSARSTDLDDVPRVVVATPAATTRTRAELDAVRAPAARRCEQLLLADRDEAVGLVNEMLAEVRACAPAGAPRRVGLAPARGRPGRPLDERIVVETAMAMIDVIRADEMSRLGVCADDDCDGVVLDLSRNRSRRYCSTTCGNRNAVAAYRARQKA